MSKKHFIAIAKILRDELEASSTLHERTRVWSSTVRLADYFKSVNPNFDRNRFYYAVNPDY